METFRNKVYCRHYEECADGEDCRQALTPAVQAQADRWWVGVGDAPIATFQVEPTCFREFDND